MKDMKKKVIIDNGKLTMENYPLATINSPLNKGWEIKKLGEVDNLIIQLEEEKKSLIANKNYNNYKQLPEITNDEIPFNIPENWRWVRLGNISIIQEGPGLRKFQYTKEGVQFITVTNILEGSIDLNKSRKFISLNEYNKNYKHFTINKGDILSSCSGATWGKTAIYNENDLIILNTSTLRLRFFGDKGDNQFLYYLTKTDFFKNQLSKYSTGQQPNYGYSHYSMITIPIPPLPEQQRIVAYLDETFAKLNQAKANLAQNLHNAKQLFESELNRIFTEKGEGWEEKKLGELCEELFAGGDAPKENYSTEKTDTFSIPIYANAVKDDGLYGYTNYARVTKPSITIAARGSGTGHTLLRNDNYFPIVRLIVLIPKTEIINLYFFKLAIETLIIERSGSAIPQLTIPMIKDYKIPFPKSLQTQQAIVSKLDALSTKTKQLENLYQQKLNNIDELKKSILASAFSGPIK